ncbi:type VI secretion system lipoprotein TssJ [Citrobacter arsenatis]|uniref:Type VI secretion system lipoprotein TssJ n=1 Tax=Citrobacter arsenatis TaxID=2546350 RepID=A0A4P6WIV3_9ENTR|nr:type VI secretion system lipoprotein TssJ [Citrobacter arsenatis]QBM22774.1 type VI secretion system lipoprotein TssJ [Citrobacter arsenatis]
MLRTSLTKSARWLMSFIVFSLVGCGVTQSVTDGSKSAFNAIFYKKIKMLHLDFTAREALNTDFRENNSLSESVVVRVYQLKDRKIFDKMVYQQLLKDGDSILKADLLASRDVVLKPGGDTNLNMPMEDNAQYIAVVGLFRHPDMIDNTWKMVIQREELDPDKPRILEAGNNHLTLLPFKDD